MSASLALAVPAAAAAAGLLAYANAKASIGYDLFMVKAMFKGTTACNHRHRAQRLNPFYDLEDWAKRPDHADAPVLIFEGRTWSYAELYDTVLRYGHWLKTEFGIKPKQVVAMCYSNTDMFVVTWMALWSIGATPAFVNYLLTGKGLAHCLHISTSDICLVDPLVAASVQDVSSDVAGMRIIVVTPDVQAKAFSSPAIRYPDEDRVVKEITDLALLIYTSGTTGFPKAAVVSWKKVYTACGITNTLLRRSHGDTMYSAMPLYHSTGSLIGFAASLASGNALALSAKFSKQNFWKEVRATKATSILYVGEALRYLLDAPPEQDPVTGENLDMKHNVKTVYGAGLRADVWRAFTDRFGIDTVVEFYGATEGVMGTLNFSRNTLSQGAIGRVGWLLKLLFNSQTTIVVTDWDTDSPVRDPETGLCIAAKNGETGEMLHKVSAEDINAKFQGYYNNAEATSKKIIRDVRTKGDAWFRSGDAMRWEDDGLLFFSDRLGDTFRWKGENVSTMEVSNVMGLHPQVSEANVYGVQLPNHDGRAGCAAISFRSGSPSEDDLKSLAAHMRKALPRYAVPLFLRLVKEAGAAASTTGTHKQQKVALRDAGVNPVGDKGEDIILYWFNGDTYIPFGKKEWQRMQSGHVKL